MEVMCEACQRIVPGQAGVAPHADLGHQGTTESTQRGREGHTEEHFRCLVCDTKWLLETDRWGVDIGFRLAP
ncbi:hypothetical protein BBB39_11560 [Bordetella trematum]|uniref:Uncharacterized protein n=1 Tax=Bordetella trematum TaxID=123899 RepID=A0A157R3S5_9BORD|nr:hypothetical protein [Bordetella trematum]AUL47489.1 hypothetical protein BTL55_11200 [Bordetella trematum]AZR94350.1 hypothetical protein BBB39_11560 [Bordetella trematum]NNH19887.1 hypothetical protein [Bordetella trematum]QIM72895.1 hypothetical protein EYB34_16840 [Bordetella trematum]SAI51707.1 Uncharacterised protein [Bordetella trematum]